MPSELISVVVPVYNKRATIAACLRSVLRQSLTDFELLVIDDGSTDGSADCVAGLPDARIRLIRQENRGRSTARNRGIAEARGSVVALLDADDTWEPGFLEAIMGLRDRFPGAGLYATGVGRCWGGGRNDLLVSVRTTPHTTCSLVPDYLETLPWGDFITASNVAIPKAVFDQVGGFHPQQVLGEDRDLWARIALRLPFACDSRILAWYYTPVETALRYQDTFRNYMPPAVETLLRELESGACSPNGRRQAEFYIDWNLVRHCEGLLWDQQLEELSAFRRRAPFSKRRSRAYTGLLEVGSRLMPARRVASLLWRPARWLRRLERMRMGGTRLDTRTAACSHLSGGGISE